MNACTGIEDSANISVEQHTDHIDMQENMHYCSMHVHVNMFAACACMCIQL